MAWAAQLLPELPAADIARLDGLPEMTLKAGQVLFRAGDTAQGFAVVLKGRVEVVLTAVTGREILLYAIEPGQSCIQTTLGLMGEEPYSGQAVTVAPCRLVILPRSLFHDLMDRSPPFRSFVFRAFAARMTELTQLLEQVAFARIETRLARALCDLAQGGEVHLTHAELAARIGSAREVVSRQLEKWAARELIVMERGRIVLREVETLRSIAM